MILIITRKDDAHADLVVKKLKELQKRFFRFNTDCASDYEIALSPSSAHIRHLATERSVNTDDIKSVWLRRRSLPKSIETAPREFGRFLEEEWSRFYRNLWVLLENRFWISPVLAIERAKDKLRQLQLAKSLGFCIPETLVTNCINDVLAFQKKFKQVVYKPHESGAIRSGTDNVLYTNVINSELLQRNDLTDNLRICPGIFQPYIEKKHEIRATVIGHKVFAVKLDSQSNDKTRIDWRKHNFDNMAHTAHQLPKEEEARCIQLIEHLGLQFGAIDLIVTPKNELYFLENNANGQWAWIEILTKQPIASEIALLLASHDEGP